LGSIAVRRLGDPQAELPQFVAVGGMPANEMAGGGFLGVEYDPFMLGEAGGRPANTTSPVADARLRRRLELLGELEAGFAAADGKQVAAEQKALVDRAARMSLSPKLAAFDLSREPQQVRESYGATPFGSGCLLARRLVEAGVTFVEIRSRGRWDTHDRHFDQTPNLSGEIDGPFARLLTDLADRGLLDETLVVWMGEFGRTPRINPRAGRDHFPKASSVVLAGGGIRGGQVIGATSDNGEQITQRPVSVPDLFATFAFALGIDPHDVQASPLGRPIKVANGGEPVSELW
jgi:uncharacterized protein (DUF1501 family)